MRTSIAARYVAHSTPIPLLDAGHRFFEPFCTNFRLGAATGILDRHTILMGVTAVAALAPHGALWVRLKTKAHIEQRALGLSLRLWVLVVLLAVAGLVFELAFRRNPLRAFLAGTVAGASRAHVKNVRPRRARL